MKDETLVQRGVSAALAKFAPGAQPNKDEIVGHGSLVKSRVFTPTGKVLRPGMVVMSRTLADRDWYCGVVLELKIVVLRGEEYPMAVVDQMDQRTGKWFRRAQCPLISVRRARWREIPEGYREQLGEGAHERARAAGYED